MKFDPADVPALLPIKHSELGKYLSDVDCSTLATVMSVRDLEDGEVLVKEGDQDNTLFIVTKGVIQVSSTVNGRKKIVNTMKAGDCAGIRSFVERTPRLVTLRAKGPAVVYTIRPDDFELLLDTYPRQAYNFMRGLFRMLNINLERMHEKIRKLALLPGSRP
ncbi:MAG: cyclic nucleotide-binding domain-containing protein [Pseudomonadota bacterium]